MIIHLPDDLEGRIHEAIRSGHFASVDDAMAKAAHLLLRELDRGRQVEPTSQMSDPSPDLFLGSMREAADELDVIVEDAYHHRREETWRDIAVE
jgi:Arc/MetJ-type ribon-helix-helix transcriptional regulator